MSNDKIEEKLDKVQEDISEIKVTLARNTASLELHMKRTEMAEEALTLLKQELQDRTEEIERKITKEILPLKDHVTLVRNTFIIITAIAAILTFLKNMGVI